MLSMVPFPKVPPHPMLCAAWPGEEEEDGKPVGNSEDVVRCIQDLSLEMH